MPHDVEGEAHVRRERQQEAVVRVVFAVRRHDGIDCDDQRLEAGAVGALDELIGEFAAVPHVELEPQPTADAGAGFLCDLLHRCHRAGRQRERDLRLGGGLRQFQLAFVPAQAGGAGRRDRHRHRHRLAEQRGGHGAAGHIDQRPVPQLDALERVAVVGDRDAVLAAAIDELEHGLGETALCRRTQVIDIKATIERGHGLLPGQRNDEARGRVVKRQTEIAAPR